MSETRIYKPESVMSANAMELAQAQSEQIEAQFQPGPFPIDALNETQRRIAESIASVHQLPIELSAMPTLAVMAAALGKGWKLTGAVNGRSNFGNLYIIPGAPKSCGKGAAAQIADPIIQASSSLVENWKVREKPDLETKVHILEARTSFLTSCIARRKEGRRQLTDVELQAFESELREGRATIERIKPFLTATPSYHVGNATSEALAMKFARNDDTLFALAYEGGDTLRVMLGKYSKGEDADFDLWLSGYSVEPYQSDRVLRGNVNITPCLTALIFCQPPLLRELYGNEEAFERGLTARVLPFICESPLQEDDGQERNVPAYHRDAWHDLIAGLLKKRQSAGSDPIQVQCKADAREVFRAFHNEIIRFRNGALHDIEGELGRCRENACRIALGLCLADDTGACNVTAAQAERAVKLARWGHFSALKVMHAGRMQRRLVRVQKLLELLANHNGQITLRDIEKSHGFKPDEVERLVADFPSQLSLEMRQNPKGGPQSRVLTTQHFQQNQNPRLPRLPKL